MFYLQFVRNWPENLENTANIPGRDIRVESHFASLAVMDSFYVLNDKKSKGFGSGLEIRN